MRKKANPTFSSPVSDEEKEHARAVRKLFTEVLNSQKVLHTHLDVFSKELEKLQDTSGMSKIAPLLRRYSHKFRDLCNEYIKTLEGAVQSTADHFKDADMSNLRDLIVESVRDIRDNAKLFIAEFRHVEDEKFVDNIKGLIDKIVQRLEQIESSISDELFAHIDFNILGKIRLSYHDLPLSTKTGSANKNDK